MSIETNPISPETLNTESMLESINRAEANIKQMMDDLLAKIEEVRPILTRADTQSLGKPEDLDLLPLNDAFTLVRVTFDTGTVLQCQVPNDKIDVCLDAIEADEHALDLEIDMDAYEDYLDDEDFEDDAADFGDDDWDNDDDKPSAIITRYVRGRFA